MAKVRNKMAFNGKVGAGAIVVYEEPAMAGRSTYFGGRVNLGAYTYFGAGGQIGSADIGRYCSIATNVTIGLGEHPLDTLSTHPFFYGGTNGFNSIPPDIGIPRDFAERKYQAPIIGNDVWIGANVVICRGVRIGNGAVIAAGAVVNKDIPGYAIVGGVPARVIRYRFREDVIDALQLSRWWDVPIEVFVGKDVKDVASIALEIITKRESGSISDAKYLKVRAPA